MDRPVAYEGTEPYIFISYAHKDSDQVLPIVTALQEQGFRVWYDAGIEAGTEWPEYIAKRLESCTIFLAFLSQSALDSPNCRREINLAIAERKEMLHIYLEELHLSSEMRMQLGALQAMYLCRYSSQASFMEELYRSRILSPCCGAAVPPVRESKLEATAALFEFTQTDDGGIEISELKDKTEYDLVIPWGVTSIGEFAFYMCKNLLFITIPNSVTNIGANAFFYCTHLTDITLPDNITSISDGAFHSCENLSSITIPHGVTSIGESSFGNCKELTSITIPDSVTSIGEFSFCDCKKLTSITIPDSVISIGKAAFNGCFKLTIYGKRGSVAEQYAAENKISFQAI